MGRGVEWGGEDRNRSGRDDPWRRDETWRGREDETRWREGAHGWRGGELDDWRSRKGDDARFGERDEWRPGERHDWRGGERQEWRGAGIGGWRGERGGERDWRGEREGWRGGERDWRGGGRDLSWEQGMEDRGHGPRYEGRYTRRGMGAGEGGDWRARPWVDSGGVARDTRGMVEWEDRGPLAWLREKLGGKPRGPKGYKRSDDRVHDEVCERIARSGIDADEVEVKVENGEVTLTGTVTAREHKWRLESIADDVWGVDDVHNHLRVSREKQGTEAERQGTADLRH
jgi:hypothetical protein